MARRYTLISSASYIPLSPHEVVVKGSALEGFSLLVEDPKRRAVTAPIIETLKSGGRTSDELRTLVTNDLSIADYDDVLDAMLRGGAITCIDDDASRADADYAWSAFVRYGEIPDSSLMRTVTVLATGRSAEVLLETARSWGVPIDLVTTDTVDFSTYKSAPAIPGNSDSATVPTRREESPLAYISFDSARAELYRINEQAVSAQVPVLYARLDGVDYSVGPYVVPGSTTCAWEAERLWARSSADREQYEMLLRHRETGPHTHSTIVGLSGMASALAVGLLELSLRGTSDRAGSVVHGRVTTNQSSIHSVMRLPRCPVCMPMQPLARNALY